MIFANGPLMMRTYIIDEAQEVMDMKCKSAKKKHGRIGHSWSGKGLNRKCKDCGVYAENLKR